MGRVFFILTTLSLMLALLTNRAPSAASALLNSAESGVSLMLTLLGTMTLWSGLMEVLLRTGDVAKLGLLIRKLFGKHSRALPDTDCWEAVGMNLAANVLGLGNAATPQRSNWRCTASRDCACWRCCWCSTIPACRCCRRRC